MIEVYVIVDRSSGAVAHRKPYFSKRDAKLALKCSKSKPYNYAVARIGSGPMVVATVDESGKWTEVSV